MKIAKKIILLSLTVLVFICLLLNFSYKQNKTATEFESALQKIFPNLPKADNHTVISIENSKRQMSFTLNKPGSAYTYYAIKNTGSSPGIPNIIINNKNWSSTAALIEAAKSQPIDTSNIHESILLRLWEFIITNTVHGEPPFYGRNIPDVDNPLQLLQSWGYGFCADRALVLAQLATIVGYPARITYLVEHVVTEIYYDETWHMLDPDRGQYYRTKDGHIASVEEIRHDRVLLQNPHMLPGMKPYPIDQQISAFSITSSPLYDYGSVRLAENLKSFTYALGPREEIRFYSNWQNDFFWSDFQTKPDVFSNGMLIGPIIDDRKLEEKIKAIGTEIQIPVHVALPYPIVNAYILFDAPIKANIVFSYDKKNWTPVNIGGSKVDLKKFFTNGVDGKIIHEYNLKIPSKYKPTHIITQFQFSKLALPPMERTNVVSTTTNTYNTFDLIIAQ